MGKGTATIAKGVPEDFEPAVNELFVPRWKLPFPREELEVYIMCAHPIGVAWERIETWVRSQDFKPPLTMVDLVDCLWTHCHCDSMGRYDIPRYSRSQRKDLYLPQDMPDHLGPDVARLFDEE